MAKFEYTNEVKPGDSVEFIEAVTKLPFEYSFKIVAGQRGTLLQIMGTCCMVSPWNSGYPVLTRRSNLQPTGDRE